MTIDVSLDAFQNASVHTPHLSFHYGLSGIDINHALTQISTTNVHHQFQNILDQKIVNPTENRPATHHACRHPNTSIDEIQTFCDGVHQNKIQINKKNIRSICHIGVGGSFIGPQMVLHALSAWTTPQKLSYTFISSHDEDHIDTQLKNINISETLFVIASKSGTTIEIQKILQAITHQYSIAFDDFFASQCAIIGSKHSPLFKTPCLAHFSLDEGIGGRFSATSSVTLVSLGLVFGAGVLPPLLKGAYEYDAQCSNMDAKNPALVHALVQHHYRQTLATNALAIVPYGECFLYLAPYLNQLISESLGKSVSIDGHPIDGATSPVIMHGIGPNAQHTFFQQLHQGQDIIPTDFIITKSKQSNQRHLLQQVIGQMLSLASGQIHTDPRHHFPGNRPSTLLLLQSRTIESLGALISHQENRVVFDSLLLNINAFDQPGVELGKAMSKDIEEDDTSLGSELVEWVLNPNCPPTPKTT